MLNPGGTFLFTSPRPACTWSDAVTGRESRSLGAEAYQGILAEVGLRLTATRTDEGSNNYYEAVKG